MLERYDPRNWPISYDGVIHTLIVLGSAVALALLAHWIVFALLRRVMRSSESALDDVVVEAVRKHFATLGVEPASLHYEKFAPTETAAAA